MASDFAATIGVPAVSFFPPALRGVFNFLSLMSTCGAELSAGVEKSVAVAPTASLTGVGSLTAMEEVGTREDGRDSDASSSRVVPLFPIVKKAKYTNLPVSTSYTSYM